MIQLLVTLPFIAFLSMNAFCSMKLRVVNYESKWVPYSLGVVVLYSYAMLYEFKPNPVEALSFPAFVYVFGIWLLGFIDDLFGKPFPKGLKGHIHYAIKNRLITTGLLKALGTVMFAILYLWMQQQVTSAFFTGLSSLFLLIGLPHVMNLFDTRPLRVWKVAFCMTVLVIVVSPLPSFLFVITLLAVFYISFVLEGHRKAMLGDNGATVIGAIVAIVVVNHTGSLIQFSALLFVVFIIIIAETTSISTIIERWSMLRFIDQIGIIKK
ncbi:hypothetical protein GN156_02125 [bacterium LRH843]|nr:hypothetical protein [bacterium LRH843]